MPPHMDATRKRIQEKLSAWRSSAHARGTAYAGHLREIQDDVAIISPKIYESGIITRLDLRLVDLYGDCIIEDDAIPTSTEHELVS
jgi:hypothetical protein